MNLPPGWTLAAILKNGDRLICTTGAGPQLYARVACTASGMDAITPVPDAAADREYMNAALSVRAATGADCRGR